jgi:L-methionine (R)-S-oxide reductase
MIFTIEVNLVIMNIETEKIINEIKGVILSKPGKDSILEYVSKILKDKVFHYDWVGFYIFDEIRNGLVLGPYTGAHTDHTYIPIGIGICGQVAKNKQTMVVQDVSTIENYLSCSINVQSEIVVPILKNGKFMAELDIDSHSPAPFTDKDTALLEKICNDLEEIF